MFDWSNESKERYFAKTEELIRAVRLERLLVIDKTKFTITKDKVKVYLVRIKRSGNYRRWCEAKRIIQGLEEQKRVNTEFGSKEKSIFINGYIVLDMEEQDKG